MFIQRQHTLWGCTSSQHGKWVKQVKKEQISLNTHNPILSMQTCSSKATYCLRVHQFTAQQVGKGGTIFHSSHKILSWVCKYVHSKATYLLRVHQITSQQVGKGSKEGINKFSLITQNPILNVPACSFKGNLPSESAPVHSTASR